MPIQKTPERAKRPRLATNSRDLRLDGRDLSLDTIHPLGVLALFGLGQERVFGLKLGQLMVDLSELLLECLLGGLRRLELSQVSRGQDGSVWVNIPASSECRCRWQRRARVR